MPTRVQRPGFTGRTSRPRKRRPAWRQRLVEAERGMTHGFRADSSFFVYFFAASVVVTAGFVLGITLMEWTVVLIAITLVLSFEMLNQALRAALNSVGLRFPEWAQKAQRIGTAAVFVTAAGGLLCVGLVFGRRFWELFAG